MEWVTSMELFLKDNDMKIQNSNETYSLREVISNFGDIISINKIEDNVINVIIQKK
jgi:hypothetical protein